MKKKQSKKNRKHGDPNSPDSEWMPAQATRKKSTLYYMLMAKIDITSEFKPLIWNIKSIRKCNNKYAAKKKHALNFNKNKNPCFYICRK